MSTARAGRGGSPSSRWRIGLVTWYGRLATTSYGGASRAVSSWSSASPSMRRSPPGAAGSASARAIGPANVERSRAASPRSSSTAVTAAPPASRPPVRIPRPGPISRIRRPRVGAASARIASRTSMSARKFCESAWRARRPASLSVRRTASASRRGGRGRSVLAAPASGPAAGGGPVAGTRVPLTGERAAGTAGRRGRGPNARRPGTGARRPPRSSPRCRCTGRAAAR